MARSRWMLLMGLVGFLGLPIACTQSAFGPEGSGSNVDFFHFHRIPTPTPTPRPLSTPIAKVTETVTPLPSATATVPAPSPTNAIPTQTQTPNITATCNPVAVLGNDFAGSVTFNPSSQEAIYAQAETATASGNLSRVSLNVLMPPLFLDGGMMGVYSDNSGQPGSLLAHSALFTKLSTGVNSFALPATAITQGTRYWLVLYAAYPNGGALLIGDAPAPGPLAQYSIPGLLNVLPGTLTGLKISFEFNAVLDMEGDICQ